MSRIVYKPNVKAAILAAVRKALGSGKSWPDAYEAATALKYTGKLQSLQKMYYKRSKPGRKAATAKAPAQAAGKRTGGQRYDPATKAAIIKAAVAARKAGRPGRRPLRPPRPPGSEPRCPD